VVVIQREKLTYYARVQKVVVLTLRETFVSFETLGVVLSGVWMMCANLTEVNFMICLTRLEVAVCTSL